MTRPTLSKKETVQPLDCPFCGAPASTYAAWDHWGVECTFCDAKIMGYSTREGAINVWNRPRRMPRPDRSTEDPAWSMRIKACCKEMADAIMMNDIRQGIIRDQDGSLSILWPDGDAMPLRFCPCCGKRVEPTGKDPRRRIPIPEPQTPYTLFSTAFCNTFIQPTYYTTQPMATAIG